MLINPNKPSANPPKPSSTQNGGTRYQIQRMLPRHFKMVELHIAGLSNRAIAQAVECSAVSVGIVLNSPIVRKEVQQRLVESRNNPNGTISQEIEAYESRVRGILEDGAELAAETIIDLTGSSDDDSIKLRASTTILDRVIGKVEPQHSPDGPQLKIEIDAKQATLIMVALNESKETKETPQDAQANESTADSSNADSSSGEQEDVHQAPIGSSGLGHRPTEAQAPTSGREVKLVKPVKNLTLPSLSEIKLVKNLNGI